MRLQDIRIAKKLVVSSIVMILTLCVAAWWLEYSVATTLRAATVRVEGITRVIRLSKEWKGLSDANAQRAIASALSTKPSMSELLKKQATATSAHISAFQQKITEAAQLPGDQDAMAEVGRLRAAMIVARDKVGELKRGGDPTVVEGFAETTLQDALSTYLQAIDKFIELQEVHREEALKAAEAAKTREEFLSLAVMGVIAAAVLAWMVMLSKSIVRPLQRAVDLANAIAEGDLTQDMKSDGRKDEIGVLMLALAQMSEKLHHVVSEVRDGVASVTTASAEIAAGNADLSNRTENAGASLEEAAASMEELTSTVSQSAESAEHASALAVSAAEAATRGQAAMGQVIERMKEISDSSNRISDIIGVIDSIAFQTNILALNAAVEAARAGDQGRGFAVVASEVRNLAQRSAGAAKEIKALIATSVERVQSGSELVAQTGAVIAEIETSVSRATAMMSEISASAREQRDGIAQVNQSVTELDEMTQQNAALVEESVAAADSLRDQAATLAQLVSMFDVGHQDAPLAPAPLQRSAPQTTVAKPARTKLARPATRGTASNDWTEF
jgi:methyl-accepting chemotaxis protein